MKFLKLSPVASKDSECASKSSRYSLVVLWKIFLDFQSILLCSPFRLKVSRNGEYASIQTCLLQKLVCGLYAFVGFFWVLRNVRHTLPTNPKDPSLYLVMALHITVSLLKLITVKKFWLDQAKLVQIVNFILDKNNNLPFPKTESHNILAGYFGKLVVPLSCSLYTGMAISHWISERFYFISPASHNHHEDIPINTWNFTSWWRGMVEEGRYTYFLQYDNNFNDTTAGILAAVGFLWRLLLGANVELFLLLVAFTLWVPASEFQKRLQPLS